MVVMDMVQVGSRVAYSDDGERVEVEIIPAEEKADPAQGRISQSSPLAEALLGARPGDERPFRVATGPGRAIQRSVLVLEVLAPSPRPAAAVAP